MPEARSTRPEDAAATPAYPPTDASFDAAEGGGGPPSDADHAQSEVEDAAQQPAMSEDAEQQRAMADGADERRTKAMVVVVVAVGMLVALALPVAAGFLAHYLLADFTDGVMLRLLLSITAGLVTMFLCNFLIVLPLGAFAGTALQRFETSLDDDERALLGELHAHDQARYGDANPPNKERAEAPRGPADEAPDEPSKIDEGSDARS